MKSLFNLLFYKYLYVIILVTFIYSCNRVKTFGDNEKVSLILIDGWSFIRITENQFEVIKDSVQISIRLGSDSEFVNTHPRNPKEYLQSEDVSSLLNFSLNEDKTIYTKKEFLKSVSAQNPGKIVKENISLKLDKFIAVDDSELNMEGIDYLGRFSNDHESHWFPIKLPEFYREFFFLNDTIQGAYRKMYYPKYSHHGRIGLVLTSKVNHTILSARSTLIFSESKYYNDIINMLKSISMH